MTSAYSQVRESEQALSDSERTQEAAAGSLRAHASGPRAR